jgi:hypothetical protein
MTTMIATTAATNSHTLGLRKLLFISFGLPRIAG